MCKVPGPPQGVNNPHDLFALYIYISLQCLDEAQKQLQGDAEPSYTNTQTHSLLKIIIIRLFVAQIEGSVFVRRELTCRNPGRWESCIKL